jgi:hypothetical protein
MLWNAREARLVGWHDRGFAGSLGGMIPTAYRRNARGHEAVVTEDGPRPLREQGTVPSGASLVVRAGRATRVP